MIKLHDNMGEWKISGKIKINKPGERDFGLNLYNLTH